MGAGKLNSEIKVSICILHFNRFSELKESLGMIKKSSYSGYEVIIVDNASPYFDKDQIYHIDKSIRIVQLKSNIGVAAWNKAFEIANGEVLLVLDDDSYPDEHAIDRAIKTLNENSDVDIIAAKIINTRTGLIETEGFAGKPDFFVGCGAFIRRRVFETIGGFNELIFIYLHELDYSARAYDAGFKIKYLPEIKIYHRQSENRKYGKNRNPYFSSFRYYHYSISYSIFLLQKFYCKHIVKYLPKWFLNRLIIAVKFGFYKEFLSALLFVISKFKKIIDVRKTLKPETQKFYRYGNIPYIDQDYLRNHERETGNSNISE